MPGMARRCCLISQHALRFIARPCFRGLLPGWSLHELLLGPCSSKAARGLARTAGPDQLYGAQVVLLAHSLGDIVARTFFHWVEQVSPGWVEQHVATYAPIAGLPLGAPVSLPALSYGALAIRLLRFHDWKRAGAGSYAVLCMKVSQIFIHVVHVIVIHISNVQRYTI